MLNLNSATAEEIDGVALLKGHRYEIVRYRAERGGFTELRQLEEVPGLAGKFEGIEALRRSTTAELNNIRQDIGHRKAWELSDRLAISIGPAGIPLARVLD